jgi:hypothetical protein
MLTLAVASSCEPVGPPTATPAPPPPAPPTTPGVASGTPCTPPAVDGALLGVYRSMEGDCIRPGRIVAVRCTSTATPLVVRRLRDRRPAVYLGGRFAVPIRGVDRDAVTLGISATERIVTVDGELLVETGGVTTRWLRLPRRARVVSHGPDAAMLGDSLLDGATPSLPSVLPAWGLEVDAVSGRTSTAGRPLVAGLIASDPEVVVVELGTNVEDPSIFRANADAILAELSRIPLVIWVVPHTPSDLAPAMADEIRASVASHPNATAADWDAFVPADALMTDGVHLLADRQGVFAEFLGPYLAEWLTAIRGRGPAGCLDRIRGAL